MVFVSLEPTLNDQWNDPLQGWGLAYVPPAFLYNAGERPKNLEKSSLSSVRSGRRLQIRYCLRSWRL